MKFKIIKAAQIISGIISGFIIFIALIILFAATGSVSDKIIFSIILLVLVFPFVLIFFKCHKILKNHSENSTNVINKKPQITNNQFESNYTVVDFETTGLNAKTCEIIEISAVKVRNNEVIDTYTTLIKPTVKITPKITEITGITNEVLKDAPSITEKFQEFLDFIGNDVILGHNISSYDIPILRRYCEELNLKPFTNDTLDTLRFSRQCYINVPNHKLTTLTKYFNIEHKNAHRALSDCIANHECYQRLKEFYSSEQYKNNKRYIQSQEEVLLLNSITEPIDGYTLKYHYKDVEVTHFQYIPEETKVGNRVVCIQEPTNEYDNKAVMLLLVPQRKKLGYLYSGTIQDMANDYINRGDKIVARLSHLSFSPCKTIKIDIAFFKKNK